MVGEGAIGLCAAPHGNFQTIAQVDAINEEDFLFRPDLGLDLGHQVVLAGDSARFQRAGKCAGQSTGETGDDVIDGRGQRLGRRRIIKCRIAPVHAKLQRLSESFDVRRAVRAFLLLDTYPRGVNDLSHVSSGPVAQGGHAAACLTRNCRNFTCRIG